MSGICQDSFKEGVRWGAYEIDVPFLCKTGKSNKGEGKSPCVWEPPKDRLRTQLRKMGGPERLKALRGNPAVGPSAIFFTSLNLISLCTKQAG